MTVNWENLEGRRLFAVLSVAAASGTLQVDVTGAGAAVTISVSRGKVEVESGGVPYGSFPTRMVQALQVRAKGGDDAVLIDGGKFRGSVSVWTEGDEFVSIRGARVGKDVQVTGDSGSGVVGLFNTTVRGGTLLNTGSGGDTLYTDGSSLGQLQVRSGGADDRIAGTGTRKIRRNSTPGDARLEPSSLLPESMAALARKGRISFTVQGVVPAGPAAAQVIQASSDVAAGATVGSVVDGWVRGAREIIELHGQSLAGNGAAPATGAPVWFPISEWPDMWVGGDGVVTARDLGLMLSSLAGQGSAAGSVGGNTAVGSGTSVSSADVQNKYAYGGDTTVCGTVDGSDLANLLAGTQGGLTGWVNGDLNYDGVVDNADLNVLLQSLSQQGSGTPPSGSNG